MAKRYNLVRWFSVISLACVAAICVALAAILSRFLTENLVHQDAVISGQFIESIVRAENTGSYFIDRESREAGKVLDSFFNHLVHMPEVVRANVFAQDRTIIWSSNENFVGRNMSPNRELEEAFAGKIISEVTYIKVGEKPEHVDFPANLANHRIVEAYIPVKSWQDDSIIGVVEIYKRPNVLFKAVDQGTQLIWMSTVVGGILLYGCLFWIVRRADQIMRLQEEKLVDSQTMAAIGELASAVAHAIRNPLASIRSSAELTIDGDLESARESATDIIVESERVDRWVGNLLEFSRVGCAAQTSKIEIFDLKDVVADCIENFRKEFERRHIDIEVDGSKALPLVRGSSVALCQAIQSVLENAVSAVSSNGHIMLAIRPDASEANALLKITDDGPGMSEQVLRQAFRPSFTTKARGLGLGLALSRRIMERYGGSIELSSVAGEGTTATITIPFQGRQ